MGRSSYAGDPQSGKSMRTNGVEVMKTPSANLHLEVERAI